MTAVSKANVALDATGFMSTLLRHLSGTLQDVVGIEDAEGFVSLVGQRIGDDLDRDYRRALSLAKLNREQVAQVLVDLKHRIGGDFYIVEEDDEKIVFGNRRCPFGDKVRSRPSLCMMTSNVFGAITANNTGYAKVELDETIATGGNACRVVVWLADTEASRAAAGREYFDAADS